MISVAISQAAFSLLNLLLQICATNLKDMNDYAVYVQISTFSAISQLLYTAIFINPFIGEYSNISDPNYFRKIRFLFARQLIGSLIAGILVFVLLLTVVNAGHDRILAFVMAGFFIFSSLNREFFRFIGMCKGSSHYIAGIDMFVVFIGFILLAVQYLGYGYFSLYQLYLFPIFAIVAPWLFFGGGILPIFFVDDSEDNSLTWRWNIWELVSAANSWVTGQSWVWFCTFALNLNDLALLAFGRLLASPLTLVWVALANYYRPLFSRQCAGGVSVRNKGLLFFGLFLVIFFSLIWAVACYFLKDLDYHDYFNMRLFDFNVTIAWVGYFFLTGVSTMLSNLLYGYKQYRSIALASIGGTALLVLSYSASLIFSFSSINAIIYSMMVGELFIMLWYAMSILRRKF